MTPNPLSLRDNLNLREATIFLVDNGISGAPVIDEAGRPVGVLTQTDILIHDREEVTHLSPLEPEFDGTRPRLHWEEFQVERVDTTAVREVMTPAVFCIPRETLGWKVVTQMVALNVHRLFVIDEDGVLVGVITTMDVLRRMIPEE
jgi:predicted transcriptional regulator